MSSLRVSSFQSYRISFFNCRNYSPRIPLLSRYAATVRLQPPRRETILELADMVTELLKIFYHENNQIAPQRILFYRDGCSESQFHEVVSIELAAIRQACERLQQGYTPTITYVVVQKRHHARVFAVNVSYRSFDICSSYALLSQRMPTALEIFPPVPSSIPISRIPTNMISSCARTLDYKEPHDQRTTTSCMMRINSRLMHCKSSLIASATAMLGARAVSV